MQGERAYSAAEAHKLGLIRRLVDRGHRPHRLFSMDVEQLADLIALEAPRPAARLAICDEILELARRCRANDIRGQLRHLLFALGLERFVGEVVSPLMEAVGSDWEHGSLDVSGEHLVTEALQCVLREAAEGNSAIKARPAVLLATPSGERHGLGLLILDMILAYHGAESVSLGVDVPLASIAEAVAANQMDIVALSISSAYPSDRARSFVAELSTMLPPKGVLWVGGAGTRRLSTDQRGIVVVQGFENVAPQLGAWRQNAC
jgi:methylmalonyl-CoA mutase cobalamin-binding subunit